MFNSLLRQRKSGHAVEGHSSCRSAGSDNSSLRPAIEHGRAGEHRASLNVDINGVGCLSLCGEDNADGALAR